MNPLYFATFLLLLHVTYSKGINHEQVFQLEEENLETSKVAPTPSPKKQCENEFLTCYRNSPIFSKYTCIYKLEDCVWKLCPVRPCFLNLNACMRKATDLPGFYGCFGSWGKCMKTHGCPKPEIY